MSAWSRDELDEIGAADEVELAPLRSDATLQELLTLIAPGAGFR